MNYKYKTMKNNLSLKITSLEIYTLILLECGSVQTNPASTNFTRFNPFNFLRHNESSSLDSNAQAIHSAGGCKYLSQPRQKYNVHCLGIPSVISTWPLKHATHMFAGFGSMATPHSQHKLGKKSQK